MLKDQIKIVNVPSPTSAGVIYDALFTLAILSISDSAHYWFGVASTSVLGAAASATTWTVIDQAEIEKNSIAPLWLINVNTDLEAAWILRANRYTKNLFSPHPSLITEATGSTRFWLYRIGEEPLSVTGLRLKDAMYVPGPVGSQPGL